jgi:hypothetical protein
MSIRRIIVSIFVVAVTFAAVLRAQNLGSLGGQVTDPNGKAVSGAKVQLKEVGTNSSRDGKTDSDGNYSFAQVRPGIYELRIEATGFKLFVQEKLEIQVSTPSTVNAKLVLGLVTESTIVTAESAQAINTTDATLGDTFSEKQVKGLPLAARNVVGVLTLQPGVIFTGGSNLDTLSLGSNSGLDPREGAVNGVRGNQMNVTVDGGDANDWQNQAAFTSALPLTLDSVQEFRVTTGGMNATDGVVSGAQIALETKSGTNNFHGNVRWYYRTAGPTANSYFNNPNEIARPRLDRNIGGASLGGPILKNRLFIFLDWEMRRDAEQVSAGPRNVPSNSLKDGVLIYQCAPDTIANPNPNFFKCAGNKTVAGLTHNWNAPDGTFGLTPAQVKQIDPAGLGINSAMLSYMGLFPSGNSPGQSADGGLAFNAFDFNAPENISSNIYTARLDWNITGNGHHTVFARGVLGGATFDLVPQQFPGQPTASQLLNNSRGIVGGYTGQFTPNLINTFHWTFTRLGEGETGNTGTAFSIRFFDTNTAFNRGFNRRVPVNEARDEVSWTHGAHTIQFGGAARFIRNTRSDNTLSFPFFTANPGSCNDCGTVLSSLGPSGFPFADSANNFNASMLMLTGAITEAHATALGDPKTGAIQPVGTPALRTFAENDFEGFAQDSWRIKPNFNITFGVHYEYETPPWEVNGFQVAPTIDAFQWLQQRSMNAFNGIGAQSSPLLSWAPAGNANGKPSWFNPNTHNFSPRFAFAWSPGYTDGFLKHIFGGPGKTSIRGGFGLFYDRIGQAIAVDSDTNGSPGTATSLVNNLSLFGLSDAPRFSGSCSNSGCTGLPALSNYISLPTTATFPFTPSADASNTDFVVDPHLKTPYVMRFSLGFQREIGKGVVLDMSYVGTLGRRLLVKADFAEFANLRDPASGQTIWQAYRPVAALAGHTFNAVTSPGIDPTNFAALHGIPSQPFFTNMMPNMPTLAAQFFCAPANVACNANYMGLTPTQAFYSFAVQDLANTLGSPSWSCALFLADLLPGFGFQTPWKTSLDPGNNGFVLFPPQFNGLAGWTNFGSSNYHSLQVGVRKNAGHWTLAANYVFSKSIDNASTAENADIIPGQNGGFTGLLYTPFDLRQGRAVSDFNIRHNFNGSFGYILPFGRGQKFGGSVNRATDLLIGGWEVTGVVRWRSGFPLSPGNGFNFPTDFFLTTPGTLLGPLSSQVTRPTTPGAFPNLFNNVAAALPLVGPTEPGLSGARNVLTGPAYAGLDLDVHKVFLMPWSDHQRIQLRVSTYNVFNSVNFGDGGLSLDPTIPNTFGQFTNTIGSSRGGAREMEFGVRFEF